MATQAERSAAMRERLLETGLELFQTQGYEATSTAALLRAAGASKGALYHHFPGKQALFEEIFERVARNAIRRAVSHPLHSESPLEDLIEGSLRWLVEARRPEVARILLEEGPRVLGFERARDLEARTSLGLVMRGLTRAVEAGEIESPDIELTARLLNAALTEAALVGRKTGRRGPSRATIEAGIRQLIEGLARR